MSPRHLVLLTNQYPYMIGDHSFVHTEIDALAARFDQVLIFNYSARSAELSPLPSNVAYGGNLYGTPRTAKLAGILWPSNIAKLARMAVREARAGSLRGHGKEFLASALVGMALSRDARLRRALAAAPAPPVVYSFWGMGAGLLLPWLPAAPSAKFVRLHGYDLYEELSGYLPFRRSLFSSVGGILAISDMSKDYLLRKYPDAALESKITVRRLGSFGPGAPGHAAPLGPTKAGSVRTIVSCSNIIELKRVHRIAQALSLVTSGEPLRWVHFGTGVLEEELRTQARGLERDGLAIEIRGATPHQEIMDFYAHNRVDAFINVSTTEGIPVSIMEAISYGIPVIATDVGGTSEIVGHVLGTGELIPTGFSDQQLAAAIEDMLASGPGAYAPRSLWESLYDAAENSRRTAALLAGEAGA